MFCEGSLFRYIRCVYSSSEKTYVFRRCSTIVPRLTNYVKFIFNVCYVDSVWNEEGTRAPVLRTQRTSDQSTFQRTSGQEANDEKKKGWHEHEIEIIEVTSKTREPRGYPCGNIIGSWDRGVALSGCIFGEVRRGMEGSNGSQSFQATV